MCIDLILFYTFLIMDCIELELFFFRYVINVYHISKNSWR